MRAVSDDDDNFVAPIAEALRGRWCHISVRLPPHFRPQILAIRSETVAHDLDADTYYVDLGGIGRGAGFRSTIAFVPGTASTLRVTAFGYEHDADSFTVVITPLYKWYAGVRVVLRRPGHLLAAIKGGFRGVTGRVRASMAIVATGQPPASFDLWVQLFDTWTDRRIARLLASERRASWPTIEALVCPGTSATSMAMNATLEALAHQALPVSRDAPDAEYVAVIQAGEIIPRHGMALLADWVVMLDRPDAIYADEDTISAIGHRHSPIFKPEPNRTLMLSGTLATGMWLIRRSCLAALPEPASRWAAAVRLETWLRLYERDGAVSTHRVPQIATQRRDDCEPEPVAILTALVKDHLRRLSITASVQSTWPIAVQPRLPVGKEPHVTIVIPSACRASHVLECLTAVAKKTSYPRFDIVVVLSQKTAPDDRQHHMIAALKTNDRIEVVFHPIATGFNYAAANNHAVGIATGSLVCLLNDDVDPLRHDWLTNLVGHFSDPAVGIVGAKLYYPNDQVQHGGIIMGLAGLGDHMNRFLPRGAPGYAFRGILDQQLSAVTGACLLIERALYESVGGMDERYASAYNDVDLCLKAGAAGRTVIFSAQTALYHYESLSFVQHYTDAEVDRWARDVALMRTRWHDVVANDPFHNPNLSLQRGHEWLPGFPPRFDYLRTNAPWLRQNEGPA